MYNNKFGKEEYIKSASYLSRLFGNQLKKGNTYKHTKKVYSINFIFGNYANENREVVNDYGFIRKVSNPNLNNEFINLYLIRLDKIKKIVYNVNEKKLIRWGKFMISENMKEMPNITGCTKLTSITIPKNISRIENALPYSGLTEINVDPDNKVYSSQDGVLFNKNKTELIQYPSAKAGDYTVPDGVETIDDYAFSWCTELTSITIPSSVNSIGYWVFDGCERLTSINIMKPKGSFDNVEYWGIDEGIIKWNYQEENDKN